MKRVFADTSYWTATINKKDGLHETAERAKGALGDAALVTSDEILAELLTLFSKHGPKLRRMAVASVKAVLDDPNITVVPQTRSSFLRGMERYKSRGDKEYSLADCVAMNIMNSQEITEILTSDHHFEQDGFTILLK